MTQRIIILATALCLLTLSACNEQTKRPLPPAKLSTAAGLIEYLAPLPAVQKVEPWQNEYADGITITTAHYTILTTLMDPLMLRQVPGFMESAYRAYQSQLPEPIETQTRFRTYLFADRTQWEQFTKGFAAGNADVYLKIVKGAYYLKGRCVAYNIGRTRTFAALGHEGWHQFNSKHFVYRLPSWLDEGIATLFETSQYYNGRFEFLPGRNGGRLGSLKTTLLADRMIPLRTLITLNPGQLVENPDAIKAYYAQSYALVRFLREGHYGKRLVNYHNLLLAGLRGNWPLDPALRQLASDRNIPLTAAFNAHVSPKLFALYIDDDFDAIQTEYTAFCHTIADPGSISPEP